MNKSILVTGGAGYIGSHACVELLNASNTTTVSSKMVAPNVFIEFKG